MAAFIATSDALARAIRRHIRRHPNRYAPGDRPLQRFMHLWIDRRRTPRQVWHAALVCELTHAEAIRAGMVPGPLANQWLRQCLGHARRLRNYRGPSPLPGSHFMTYGA